MRRVGGVTVSGVVVGRVRPSDEYAVEHAWINSKNWYRFLDSVEYQARVAPSLQAASLGKFVSCFHRKTPLRDSVSRLTVDVKPI